MESKDNEKDEVSGGIKSHMQSFMETTSAHGFGKIAEARKIFTKALWGIAIVLCIVYICYQTTSLVSEYRSYPVNVNIALKYKKIMKFPAVTVCNMNILRVSQLNNTRLKGLVVLSKDIDFEDYQDFGSSRRRRDVQKVGDVYYPDENTRPEEEERDIELLWRKRRDASPGTTIDPGSGEEDDQTASTTDWPYWMYTTTPYYDDYDYQVALGSQDDNREFYNASYGDSDAMYKIWQLSSAGDLSDIADTCPATADEIDVWGHQADRFIVQCSFDKKECFNKDFYKFQNHKYGNCFTWNHGRNGSNIEETTKFGSQYGLRLTLDIERDEYIGAYSPSYGVRVVIHDPDLYPFPEALGYSVSAGKVTDISMTWEEISRIGPPHGNCSDEVNFDNFFDDKNTILSCQESCLQAYLAQHCRCVNKISRIQDKTYKIKYGLTNMSRCDITNATQDKCMRRRMSVFEAGHYSCPCYSTACREIHYRTQMSQSDWPTSQFLSLFRKRLLANRNVTGKVSANDTNWSDQIIKIATARSDYFLEDFCQVHVFFESFNYHYISETPAYTVERLLSDFGGTMGLFIGASVLTGIELLSAAFGALYTLCWSIRHRFSPANRSITPVEKLNI